MAQAWSDSATGPLRFELLSTLDRHLLDDDPGEVAARNDTLLAIVAQTEADGAIAEDASGSPMLEVLSIVGFHLVAANTYEATVFRGRVGTRKRSFSAGAEVWIIPRVGVTSFIHADFGALQADGQLGFFRLQPFSIFAARELTDCPNVRFNFPSGAAYAPVVIWDHPTDLLTSLNAAPAAVAFRGRVEDQDRNLVQFSLAYRPSDGSETTVVNQPLGRVGSHPFDHSIPFPSSGLYTVTARAQDDSGRTTESVRQIEITPPADQVATPVISPTTGGYRSSRTVTITCSTPGATILYVVTSSFGSPPETGWLTYNPAAKPVVPSKVASGPRPPSRYSPTRGWPLSITGSTNPTGTTAETTSCHEDRVPDPPAYPSLRLRHPAEAGGVFSGPRSPCSRTSRDRRGVPPSSRPPCR